LIFPRTRLLNDQLGVTGNSKQAFFILPSIATENGNDKILPGTGAKLVKLLAETFKSNFKSVKWIIYRTVVILYL
jgi:hypothetical protein